MKKCTYCGIEYSDDAKACVLDKAELVSLNKTAPENSSETPHLDEATAQRHALKQKALTIAKSARAECASFGEIENQLIKAGIDQELITEIIRELEAHSVAENDKSEMRHGIYWLVGGILITLITLALASSSRNEGVYIVAWGPVLAGAAQFVRAWSRSKERN